eukprot:766761-Hanusia_phi.AAC.7
MPRSRHHFKHSFSCKKPNACPSCFCILLLSAHLNVRLTLFSPLTLQDLRLPSMMKATCRGMGPHRSTRETRKRTRRLDHLTSSNFIPALLSYVRACAFSSSFYQQGYEFSGEGGRKMQTRSCERFWSFSLPPLGLHPIHFIQLSLEQYPLANLIFKLFLAPLLSLSPSARPH